MECIEIGDDDDILSITYFTNPLEIIDEDNDVEITDIDALDESTKLMIDEDVNNEEGRSTEQTCNLDVNIATSNEVDSSVNKILSENSLDVKDEAVEVKIEDEDLTEYFPQLKPNEESVDQNVDRFEVIEEHSGSETLDLDKEAFSCDQCDFLSTSESKVARHISKAHKACKCEICDKLLSCASSLGRHKRLLHSGNNANTEVVCLYCQKKCKRKSYLSGHMKGKHNKRFKDLKEGVDFKYIKKNAEKTRDTKVQSNLPFKCLHCDAVYLDKKPMYRHLKMAHKLVGSSMPNTDYKAVPWPKNTLMVRCLVCRYLFKTTAAFKDHMQLTHDEDFKSKNDDVIEGMHYEYIQLITVEHAVSDSGISSPRNPEKENYNDVLESVGLQKKTNAKTPSLKHDLHSQVSEKLENILAEKKEMKMQQEILEDNTTIAEVHSEKGKEVSSVSQKGSSGPEIDIDFKKFLAHISPVRADTSLDKPGLESKHRTVICPSIIIEENTKLKSVSQKSKSISNSQIDMDSKKFTSCKNDIKVQKEPNTNIKKFHERKHFSAKNCSHSELGKQKEDPTDVPVASADRTIDNLILFTRKGNSTDSTTVKEFKKVASKQEERRKQKLIEIDDSTLDLLKLLSEDTVPDAKTFFQEDNIGINDSSKKEDELKDKPSEEPETNKLVSHKDRMAKDVKKFFSNGEATPIQNENHKGKADSFLQKEKPDINKLVSHKDNSKSIIAKDVETSVSNREETPIQKENHKRKADSFLQEEPEINKLVSDKENSKCIIAKDVETLSSNGEATPIQKEHRKRKGPAFDFTDKKLKSDNSDSENPTELYFSKRKAIPKQNENSSKTDRTSFGIRIDNFSQKHNNTEAVVASEFKKVVPKEEEQKKLKEEQKEKSVLPKRLSNPRSLDEKIKLPKDNSAGLNVPEEKTNSVNEKTNAKSVSQENNSNYKNAMEADKSFSYEKTNLRKREGSKRNRKRKGSITQVVSKLKKPAPNNKEAKEVSNVDKVISQKDEMSKGESVQAKKSAKETKMDILQSLEEEECNVKYNVSEVKRTVKKPKKSFSKKKKKAKKEKPTEESDTTRKRNSTKPVSKTAKKAKRASFKIKLKPSRKQNGTGIFKPSKNSTFESIWEEDTNSDSEITRNKKPTAESNLQEGSNLNSEINKRRKRKSIPQEVSNSDLEIKRNKKSSTKSVPQGDSDLEISRRKKHAIRSVLREDNHSDSEIKMSQKSTIKSVPQEDSNFDSEINRRKKHTIKLVPQEDNNSDLKALEILDKSSQNKTGEVIKASNSNLETSDIVIKSSQNREAEVVEDNNSVLETCEILLSLSLSISQNRKVEVGNSAQVTSEIFNKSLSLNKMAEVMNSAQVTSEILNKSLSQNKMAEVGNSAQVTSEILNKSLSQNKKAEVMGSAQVTSEILNKSLSQNKKAEVMGSAQVTSEILNKSLSQNKMAEVGNSAQVTSEILNKSLSQNKKAEVMGSAQVTSEILNKSLSQNKMAEVGNSAQVTSEILNKSLSQNKKAEVMGSAQVTSEILNKSLSQNKKAEVINSAQVTSEILNKSLSQNKMAEVMDSAQVTSQILNKSLSQNKKPEVVKDSNSDVETFEILNKSLSQNKEAGVLEECIIDLTNELEDDSIARSFHQKDDSHSLSTNEPEQSSSQEKDIKTREVTRSEQSEINMEHTQNQIITIMPSESQQSFIANDEDELKENIASTSDSVSKTKRSAKFACKYCKFKTSKYYNYLTHFVKSEHDIHEVIICPHCEVFTNFYRSKIKAHIQEVHLDDNRSLYCTVCPFESISYDRWLQHMKEHIANVAKRDILYYICMKCNYKTLFRDRLINHCKAEHEGDSLKKCLFCDYYGDSNKLKIHLNNTHHNNCGIFNCSFCTLKSDFLLTFEDVSIENENILIACSYCDDEFISQGELEIHMKASHKDISQNYICLQCDIGIATENAFIEHMKLNHDDSARFYCVHCHFKTNLKDHLADHIAFKHGRSQKYIPVIEVNLDDYNCEFCSFKAKRAICMIKHMHKNHKTDLRLPDFNFCPSCGIEFEEMTDIRKHLKRHAIECRTSKIKRRRSKTADVTKQANENSLIKNFKQKKTLVVKMTQSGLVTSTYFSR